MAPIEEIKQKIDAMGEGEFQTLCDAYLSAVEYKNIVSLGTKPGTKKTTKGTPDTYIPLDNGKYIFAEYTTQKQSLTKKIIDDLSKCFDEKYTQIPCSNIVKVLYFHTSSNLTPAQNKEIRDFANQYNVPVELMGIDAFANILYKDHAILCKDYLEISVSTDQIFTKETFIKKYDNAPTAAPLDTAFMFRKNEIAEIKSSLSEFNAVLISGDAGIGKTRLALEVAEQYAKENGFEFWVIRNNNEQLWDDLQRYFKKSGKYVILIDDANEINNIKTYLEFLRDRSEDMKILITVRKYAFDEISSKLDSVMKNKQVAIKQLKDEEIEKLVGKQFNLNQHALEIISNLSNGNPRVAFLAGKLAMDTNKLSSLGNIADLYKNYYGSALNNKVTDEKTFICAGIIAFVKKINLDFIEKYKSLFDLCKISEDEFKTNVCKLNDYEIVDVYKNKGVKYSDQCLSDFILYYVFIEKRYISLSGFIKIIFNDDISQTVQSINTLTNRFYSEENFRFIKSEIKIVWDELKDNDKYQFEKFFLRFHTLFPIDTLSIINDKIEETQPMPFENPEELKADKNKNNFTENWLDVLVSFNDNVSISEYPYAVDLFLMYFLKCPADYENIIIYGKRLSAIKKEHIQYNYYEHQINFVNKLIKASKSWKNRYITVLFLDIVSNILKVHFEQTESKRDNIVFVHGSIPYSDKLIELRKLILSGLVELSKIESNSIRLLDVVSSYIDDFDDSNKAILVSDLPFIYKIFNNINQYQNIRTMIVADYIQKICNNISVDANVHKN